MYAFQLSFPFPGIAPAFLNIVQNRKILRNDLIIHCFWQQVQSTMFPSLFFLSLAGYTLEQIRSLTQLKHNKSAKGSSRERASQPAHADFLNLTLRTVDECVQKADWHGMAQKQKCMAQARATTDSSTAVMLPHQTAMNYFIECTYTQKRSIWVIYAEVSIAQLVMELSAA